MQAEQWHAKLPTRIQRDCNLETVTNITWLLSSPVRNGLENVRFLENTLTIFVG